MEILVTGSDGFVGRNLVPKLIEKGHGVISVSRKDYNLLEQSEVRQLFKEYKPDAVFHLAAKVGGILANKNSPAEFIYENLQINTNVFEQARIAGIKRLVYLFGGCSYPADSPNPIKEEYLFKGLPDGNAMYYSMAKATGYLQVKAYDKQYGLDWISLIPGNIYGPYDNFSDKNSHVIPGLIQRFHFAKERDEKQVVVWGTGSPIRDFIYIEDVAGALICAFEEYHNEIHMNISSGTGVSIRDLIEIIKQIVGFEGEIIWDKTKPDGHPIKVFDVTKMKTELKFEPKISLDEGIKRTYEWFIKNIDSARL